MNHNELMSEIGLLKLAVVNLSRLTFWEIDYLAKVDKDWKVSFVRRLNVANESRCGNIWFANLPRRTTQKMIDSVAVQIQKEESRLEAYVRNASKHIQAMLFEVPPPAATAVFHRGDCLEWSTEIIPQAGPGYRFTDAADVDDWKEPFEVQHNLSETTMHYQLGFINDYWLNYMADPVAYSTVSEPNLPKPEMVPEGILFC